MKSTTQNIASTVLDESYAKNVEWLAEFMFTRKLPTTYGESEIHEVITKSERISQFLSKDSWIDVIDSLSKQKRNELYQRISGARVNLANFINQEQNSSYIQEYVNNIELAFDILFPYLEIVERKMYQSEVGAVQRLKSQYKSLLPELNLLLNQKSTAKTFIDDVSKIRASLDELSGKLSHIKEMEAEIEGKKNQIKTFWLEIETYQNSLKNGETALDGLKKDYESRLSSLTEESISIKQRANDLINLVNDWALGHNFKTKANEIGWMWLLYWGVGGSIFVWVVFVFLTFEYITFDEVGDWALVMLRLSLFSPFWLLAWIFYREYSYYKRLKEEYDFKSVLSLSLKSFSDAITTHPDPDTKWFIQSTIDKIFEHPLKDFQKEAPLDEKIAKSVLENTMQLWKKITDKMIEKI